MPVQVTIHEHSPLIVHVSHEMLSVEDGRVKEHVGTHPPPVQVHAEKGASLVPENYPIYIQHGDDAEYEVSSQICGLI